MGNKVTYELGKLTSVQTIQGEYERSGIYERKALGSYGVIPPYFIAGEDIFTGANTGNAKEKYTVTGIVHSVMPLKLNRKGKQEKFIFPLDPLVTISGKNIIVRRNVAKTKESGTVKERWGQDDYDISIQGVFTSEDEDKYPTEYVKELLDIYNEKQEIEVEHALLLDFGIKYLAIESISFPHTKGVNNQSFVIKAYSDNPVDLFVSV